MSDPRHSGSRHHSRGGRLHGYGRDGHGCSKCHEESGHGERDFFGGRRGGGGGGEKIGWGRNGAVRLDDPPILRRERDDLDDGMGPPGEMDGLRAGYRAGLRAGRMARMGGASRMDPFGGQGVMDQLGGFGGMDPLGELGMGGMGMGMGGRGPLGSPMMAGNPLGPPQSLGRQAFAEDPMLGLRQQALRQGLGMEQFGSPLMGSRQGPVVDLGLGLRSTPGSIRSRGSFDMRAMDRPRNPYGPLQNNSFHDRLANYRSPYVEDYEGSELEVGMAQQAAMQQMMNGGGGNPFLYNEAQYGHGGLGGMGQIGQMSQIGQMGGVVGMGGGMLPY